MSSVFDEVKRTPNKMLLLPKVITDLTPDQLKDISNGCGPASMKVKLIPDSILDCDFFPACCGHDATYYFGQDEWDKEEADILFLANMLREVNRQFPGDGLIERLKRKTARHAAWEYFVAVADWGKKSFWKDKEV